MCANSSSASIVAFMLRFSVEVGAAVLPDAVFLCRTPDDGSIRRSQGDPGADRGRGKLAPGGPHGAVPHRSTGPHRPSAAARCCLCQLQPHNSSTGETFTEFQRSHPPRQDITRPDVSYVNYDNAADSLIYSIGPLEIERFVCYTAKEKK